MFGSLARHAKRQAGRLWSLGLAAGLAVTMAATGPADAHDEKARAAFLRMRTLNWYDVKWSKTSVNVNEEYEVTGKLRITNAWPTAMHVPENAFLNIGQPGPAVATPVAVFVGGQLTPGPIKFELGKTYEFRVLLKARRPGNWHTHVQLSVETGGPIPGPGQYIDIEGPGQHIDIKPILETNFSPLYERGSEKKDFGLFSYLLIPSHSTSAEKLLLNIFAAVPTKPAADLDRINILYLPLKSAFRTKIESELKREDPNVTKESLAQKFSTTYYDYLFARQFLNRICSRPAKKITEFCSRDHDSGLYILTYVHPATATDHIPFPFLLVDLSHVPEKAFPEFIKAFKDQVKRKDMTDSECIDTVILGVLNVIISMTEWTLPLQERLKDILPSASEAAEHVIDKGGK